MRILVVGPTARARDAAERLGGRHDVVVPELVGWQLLEYVHREGRSFDAALFFDHTYEGAVKGVLLLPERAAFVPCLGAPSALDDLAAPALFFVPRALGFQSEAEAALVRARFHNGSVPAEILADDDALERLVALAAFSGCS